jgi:hypothetical protein
MIKNNFNSKSIKNQSFVIKFGAQCAHFSDVKSGFTSPDSGVKILCFHNFYLVAGVLVANERLVSVLALLAESWSLKNDKKS